MKRAPPFLRQTPCWGSLRSTVNLVHITPARLVRLLEGAAPARPTGLNIIVGKVPTTCQVPPSWGREGGRCVSTSRGPRKSSHREAQPSRQGYGELFCDHLFLGVGQLWLGLPGERSSRR